MEKYIILLVGAKGAGKSTVSSLLRHKLPRTAFISLDGIRNLISDAKPRDEDNVIARKGVFELTRSFLGSDISVVLDGGMQTEDAAKGVGMRLDFLARSGRGDGKHSSVSVADDEFAERIVEDFKQREVAWEPTKFLGRDCFIAKDGKVRRDLLEERNVLIHPDDKSVVRTYVSVFKGGRTTMYVVIYDNVRALRDIFCVHEAKTSSGTPVSGFVSRTRNPTMHGETLELSLGDGAQRPD